MIDNSRLVHHPAMLASIEMLQSQYGNGICAILCYGSCLRSGDLFDGLVDLYVIVDNYRSAYANRWLAMTNSLLPPNVFYCERPVNEAIVRSKYAVLSVRDFCRGVSKHWFQSYLWGRFTQPLAVVYSRDDAAWQLVKQCRDRATVTFLERVLPRLPANGTVKDLWVKGLQLSYHTELRAEKAGRSAELVDADLDYYVTITRKAAPLLRCSLQINDSDGHEVYYCSDIAMPRRLISRCSWLLRRVQGKLLSVMRLLKALFTFKDGLDYVAWKLERHSGQRVVIPDKVRRYPLLFIWGFCWRLYRRGLFR